MRKYEGFFIFPPDEAPEAWKGEEKRLEEILSRLGGRILERKDWGRRLLGYSLRKFREGRILLWNFEMEGRQVGEFRKALELDEKILKAMVVRPPEPKPVPEPVKNPHPSKGSTRETHAGQSQ